MVVFFLGATVLLTVVMGYWLNILNLQHTEKGQEASFDLPDGLIALGSAAVGALAGLLAPQPNQQPQSPAPPPAGES